MGGVLEEVTHVVLRLVGIAIIEATMTRSLIWGCSWNKLPIVLSIPMMGLWCLWDEKKHIQTWLVLIPLRKSIHDGVQAYAHHTGTWDCLKILSCKISTYLEKLEMVIYISTILIILLDVSILKLIELKKYVFGEIRYNKYPIW